MKKAVMLSLIFLFALGSFVVYEIAKPEPKAEAFTDIWTCVLLCEFECYDGRPREMARLCYDDCIEFNCVYLEPPLWP